MKRALLPLLAALLLAVPVSAQAAGPAAATITSCKADRLTVAGKVNVTGRARSRVRGAVLQMRFQAMPLFGLPKASAWRDIGKKSSGSGEQEFTGLVADNWVAVLSWRFMKGRKKVLAGDERSQPVKVGRAKGKANCTVAEGAKPVDATPPALFIAPADAAVWHRAPTSVQLLAKDDFSGVKSVRYSLDGGPTTELRNGSTFEIGSEGPHTIQWAATDVAGNTATRSDVVRVDAAPPSKPALSRPFSVTVSTTPTFQWSASTDTGSRLKNYVLVIRRPDGSLVSVQGVDASATSVVASTGLTDGATYTATLTAVDNSEPAWTTDSDPLTFKVDSQLDATPNPAGGTIIAGSSKGNVVFNVALDRVADQTTVSNSTVLLEPVDPAGSPVPATVGCNSPCTTIALDPNGTLGEGRYLLKFNGVKSQEGAGFASPDARYAVPFAEGDSIPTATTLGICTQDTTTTSPAYSVSASVPGETATLDFDVTYSGGGGWSITALYNGTAFGATLEGVGGGHYKFTFPIGGHTGGLLSFRLAAHCSSTSVSASNLFGSRVP